MNHVMIDIETMGKNPRAPIASIGAVFFNPKTGELGEQFYCRVDFENDMLNGAVTDSGTIKWWLRQSPEASAELISDDATPIWGAISQFSDWLTDNAESLKTLKVWANSPSFDCTILKSAFERTEIDIPWNYWNERDVRTMKEVGFAIMNMGRFLGTAETIGVKHNALDDAINQVALVSAVMSRLVGNKPEKLGGCDWIDWNELSKRGLLARINHEIMHPIGLAIFRDQETGGSGGALISPDGKWEYGKNLHEPLSNLIFSEVADFFAGLEQPGAPRSAADMQKALLCRLERVIRARTPQ
ncbi:phage-related protein [Pectobacterium atrosepticum SCRI1043]|uniref:Phage-related protein n=1 Tax=Pectobacterium atrosepticum (strain SCRI 1043 / ATCC BAA-672) TaxID=218491 RepID=Q6D3W3_PECAS|nr:3'-5' exonuclease [Pectobacterium atrosepticum]AIK13748.1 phage-related protein [Pectobacterium atrosepticum]MCL6315381.1 3'-5' exoribonuclease [Pectobacterium atrosepticum]MCL6320384.1 3'-5' exoribonuclease [Pectobacterium atrosepticum]CAG75531.1 phage-related protein [Pectobacterium atrosepticum SCRI1043]